MLIDEMNGNERRQHPRLNLEGKLLGKIVTIGQTPIVNLSEGGALLETGQPLKPGSQHSLQVETRKGHPPLSLAAKVIRAYVEGFKQDAKGETKIRYRLALKFLDGSPAAMGPLQALIKAILDVQTRASGLRRVS